MLLTELLIKGMPHDQLSEEFKQFISKELSLADFKIVHYQLKSNAKVLLLRIRKANPELFNKKLDFKSWSITLTELVRPIVSAVNIIESTSNKLEKLGKTKLKLPKFAVVFINNFPDSAKEADVRDSMAKFGKIEKIEIHEKGELKGDKRLRCRLGTVYFDSIDGAIEAFYNDKVDINGYSSKIKLYLNVQRVKAFLKKKNLLPKNFFQKEFQSDRNEGHNHNSNSTSELHVGSRVLLYDQLGHVNSPIRNKAESKAPQTKGKNNKRSNFAQNCSGRPNGRGKPSNLYQQLSRIEDYKRLHRRVDKRYRPRKTIRVRKDLEIEGFHEEFHHPKDIRVNVSPLLGRQEARFAGFWHEPTYEDISFTAHPQYHQTLQKENRWSYYTNRNSGCQPNYYSNF